jgi:hypothetical protein
MWFSSNESETVVILQVCGIMESSEMDKEIEEEHHHHLCSPSTFKVTVSQDDKRKEIPIGMENSGGWMGSGSKKSLQLGLICIIVLQLVVQSISFSLDGLDLQSKFVSSFPNSTVNYHIIKLDKRNISFIFRRR